MQNHPYQHTELMKKTFFLTVLAAIGTSLMSGCSKTNDPMPTAATTSAPRSYQVEYRVTSTTDKEATYFAYMNETGGTTTLTTLALPAILTFKRTMKPGDHVSFLAALPSTSPATSEMTGEILLDGKQVVTGTGRGAGADANVVYVIH